MTIAKLASVLGTQDPQKIAEAIDALVQERIEEAQLKDLLRAYRAAPPRDRARPIDPRW